MIKDPLFRYAYEEEKSNIGGLLLFFCVSRIIISPIFVVLKYYFNFQPLGGFMAAMSHATILWVFVAMDALLIALGMTAGVLIYGLSAWGVRLAKAYLILSVLVPLAAAFLLKLLGNGTGAEQTARSAASGMIFSVLWFIYLFKSERVKHLYEIERIKRGELVATA